MKMTQETITLQDGGQITIPDWLIKQTGLQIGEALRITNIRGLIIVHEANGISAVDLLEELGKALNESGYNTREKVHSLIDEVKMEVTEEWENRPQEYGYPTKSF